MSKGMPSRFQMFPIIPVVLTLCTVFQTSPARESPKDDRSFSITEPILCKDVRGFEDYEELKSPELTSEDKLLVYFRPRHFKVAPAGEKFEAHFTQDGKIRRKGEKPVVWQKTNLLDYKPKADTREMPIFLKNAISLKTLKPGDYQLEITLRDEIGQSAPALKTVFFKVVPVKSEGEKTKGAPPSEARP